MDKSTDWKDGDTPADRLLRHQKQTDLKRQAQREVEPNQPEHKKEAENKRRHSDSDVPGLSLSTADNAMLKERSAPKPVNGYDSGDDFNENLYGPKFGVNGMSMMPAQKEKPSAIRSRKEIDSQLLQEVLKSCPEEITSVINLLNRDDIDKALKPKKLLLVGDPGTGKTTLAHAIAQSCNRKMFIFKAPLIANEYQNSGNTNLAEIFSKVAHDGNPCVIVIDELQELTKKTNNERNDDSSMVASLWSLLDEYENSNIFFIGILNKVKKMPPQLLDRQELIVECLLPDESQREKIIEFCKQRFKKIKFDDSLSTQELVTLTAGFSKRKITRLFEFAMQIALARDKNNSAVTREDVLKAIKFDKSSREKWKAREKSKKMSTAQKAMLAIAAGGTVVAGGALLFQYKTHQQNMEIARRNLTVAKWGVGTAIIGVATGIAKVGYTIYKSMTKS